MIKLETAYPCTLNLWLKGKENGKIRMKVSVIDIIYYCSMCMH